MDGRGADLDGAAVEDPRLRLSHNVGHFRYLEASYLDGAGQPVGDLAVWDELGRPRRSPSPRRKRIRTWWVRYSVRGREIRESSQSTRRGNAFRLLKRRLAELARGQ